MSRKERLMQRAKAEARRQFDIETVYANPYCKHLQSYEFNTFEQTIVECKQEKLLTL